MDILINFGKQYFESGPSYLFGSLFTTFLGAFLGFLGALYIDRRVKKRQDRDKSQEAAISAYNQLQYFLDVLDQSINWIPKQITNFDEFATLLHNRPYEILLPKSHPNSDLFKLKNVDSKGNMDSFFLFNENSKENVTLYRNCFSYANFLFELFNSADEGIRRSIDFKHRDQLIVSDFADEIALLIQKRLFRLEQQNLQSSTEYNFLKDSINTYRPLVKEFIVFESLRTDFLVPLVENALNLIESEEIADAVFIKGMKALARLKNIRANSLSQSAEYKNYKEQVEASLNHLIKIRDQVSRIERPKEKDAESRQPNE